MKLRSIFLGRIVPTAVAFTALVTLVLSGSAGLHAQTCNDWKNVVGWQGTYTLSSSGSFVHNTINAYSINESTGATVSMPNMTSGLCNQLRWQGADLHNTGSVNDSTQVLNACMQGQWFTTDTLVGSSGFPSNSELVVDATGGTFSFQPIPSDSALHTIYNCTGQQGQQIQWATGPASNWPLNFPLPSQVGPLTVTNYGFAAAGRYAGYQDISWTWTFNLTPILAGYKNLTVGMQGNGTVTSIDGVINCPGVCSHYYPPNTQVTLNATPGQGFTFVGWSGACTGTGPCTVTMSQDLTVNAIFSQPLQFVALAPCRVIDTRNPNGPFGGPPLQGGSQRSFPVPQSNCGVPAEAQAYSLNITVVPNGALGYLTVWPTGENQPLVSTMNSPDGRIKANAAIVPRGTDGAISFYATNTTNLVVDIDGYFTTAGNGTSQFFALPPCRVIDTRGPNGDLGGPFLSGGVQRNFPVQQSPCGPAMGTVGGLIGNGDGSFQPVVNYPSGLYVIDVVAADLNGDGKPDLITLNGNAQVIGVLIGNGNGTFQAPVFYGTGGDFPRSAAVGDFNGDGKADVVVANDGGNYNVGVLLGNGDGTLRPAMAVMTGSPPRAVKGGDFNGDTKLDLVTADDAANTVSVLLGNGDGTFQAPTSSSTGVAPYSLALGDFNHDGKLDVATADNVGNTVSVLLGIGNGRFQIPAHYTVGAQPTSVAVGDFNLDSKPDLAVISEGSNSLSILLNNGNGSFQQPVNYNAGNLPTSVIVADFNGDGKPDVAFVWTVEFGGSQVAVMLGNGDGSLRGPTNYAVGFASLSLDVADFNRDGKLDIAVDQGVAVVQVQAYSFNVTAVPHPSGHPLSYLTVWPQGQNKPLASTLNNPTATIVANAAIVPSGSGGGVSVFPAQDTDLVVDINGYFAAPAGTGLSLYPVAPCRAFDSRNNHGQPFGGERTVNVVGSPCAPPAAAQAYVFNATVVPSGGLGYLTLWPDGQVRPVASTLNAIDGFIASNMAIVPTNNGSVDAYASGLTHLVLDISSFFAP